MVEAGVHRRKTGLICPSSGDDEFETSQAVDWSPIASSTEEEQFLLFLFCEGVNHLPEVFDHS